MEPGGEQGASMRVQFVLPKGAYATTVLSNVFEIEERARGLDTEPGAKSEAGRAEEE